MSAAKLAAAAASRAKLLASHTFPGPFMFKAIGPGGPSFADAIAAAVARTLPEGAALQVQVRASAQGAHQAVTIEAAVPSAQAVLDVYAALAAVPDVKMVL